MDVNFNPSVTMFERLASVINPNPFVPPCHSRHNLIVVTTIHARLKAVDLENPS